MISNAQLHHCILSYIIHHGYAPELPEIASILKESPSEVEAALYRLQEYHGVVLHPHTPKVWVIHPFSLAPTNFVVRSPRGEWWGNCAWCSLGVAALLKEDVRISTRSGAKGDNLEIHIVDGKLKEKDLFIHFPIPMKQAWDNVIYTCSTMLAFQSQAEIEVWCKQHRIPLGDIQPIDKIWEFSKAWYGNHLAEDWTKWTLAEAKELFAQYDLTHPVWQLDGEDERF